MKRISLLFTLFIFSFLSAFAQKGYSAKSGDKDLDGNLKHINVNAHVDLSMFKKNLSVDFGVEEGKLDHLMVALNLQPADLYMILQVGKILNKPYDEVGDCYKKHHEQGWGVIAKDLGIKPGSKEFHMLKDCAKDKKMKCERGDGNDQGEDHDDDDNHDHDHNHSRKGNSGNGKSKGKGKGHGKEND